MTPFAPDNRQDNKRNSEALPFSAAARGQEFTDLIASRKDGAEVLELVNSILPPGRVDVYRAGGGTLPTELENALEKSRASGAPVIVKPLSGPPEDILYLVDGRGAGEIHGVVTSAIRSFAVPIFDPSQHDASEGEVQDPALKRMSAILVSPHAKPLALGIGGGSGYANGLPLAALSIEKGADGLTLEFLQQRPPGDRYDGKVGSSAGSLYAHEHQLSIQARTPIVLSCSGTYRSEQGELTDDEVYLSVAGIGGRTMQVEQVESGGHENQDGTRTSYDRRTVLKAGASES